MVHLIVISFGVEKIHDENSTGARDLKNSRNVYQKGSQSVTVSPRQLLSK
jgi:hypothetical protein